MKFDPSDTLNNESQILLMWDSYPTEKEIAYGFEVTKLSHPRLTNFNPTHVGTFVLDCTLTKFICTIVSDGMPEGETFDSTSEFPAL